MLYIHPRGHLNELAVPAGAIACLNAIEAPKLGRYAFEVSDAEIRQARVIAIDVHWALALSGFDPLVSHIRRLNPDAAVVVGGITAGHYAAEILHRYPVDYVLRGDSETAFCRLVESLLDGHVDEPIPNVFSQSVPDPVRLRMTSEAFDAADYLTVDWFPTYAQATEWDAAAFGPGRTFPVARGCQLRCPGCYGSFASLHGAGYLLRSPASVVAVMERAAALRVRNFRLFLGKVPRPQLAAIIDALVSAGPFQFDSSVGFYLCTPPTVAQLASLESCIDGGIAISAIPPQEHVPKPRQAGAVERELAQWRDAAMYVAASDNLQLDMWVTEATDLQKFRRTLGDLKTDRIGVNSAAVWLHTRPQDGEPELAFDEVHRVLGAVWSFYAARLLSPALSALLVPFRFLDEIDEIDQDELSDASGRPELAEAIQCIAESWRAHRLPLLWSLRFSVIAGHLRPEASSSRELRGVFFHGDLSVSTVDDLVLDDAAVRPLAHREDHRGVVLESPPIDLGEFRAVAIVSNPMGVPMADQGWVKEIGREGVVVLRASQLTEDASARGPFTVRVVLRVQDADVALLDSAGMPVARGRADLAYFRRG